VAALSALPHLMMMATSLLTGYVCYDLVPVSTSEMLQFLWQTGTECMCGRKWGGSPFA